MKARTHFISAFSLLIFSAFLAATTARAEVSTQCSIDHAITGAVEFNQCPRSEENDDILNAGYNGARLDASVHQSQTPIWVYNSCRYADAISLSNALFIPLRTSEEWDSFLTNTPKGVRLADCCLPRALQVGDVPAPKAACASGWVLKALVDTKNHDLEVAVPNSAAPDAGFSFVSGQSEDGAYPISRLPVQRDDIGAVLPDATHPEKTYAANFACGSTEAVVEFRMQCTGSAWQTEDGGTVTATTTPETIEPAVIQPVQMTPIQSRSVQSVSTVQQVTGRTASAVTSKPAAKTSTTKATHVDPDLGCIQGSPLSFVQACPDGQTGFITKRRYVNCSGQLKEKLVTQTCKKAGTGGGLNCTPQNVHLVTHPCTDGLTGTYTRKEYVDCFGRPKADTVSYNCTLPTSGCIESTILERFEPCPAGSTGFIRSRFYKSCPSGDRKYQQVENLCM